MTFISTKDRVNKIIQIQQDNSLKFKLVNYIAVDVSLRNTMSFPSVDHIDGL